MKRRRPSRIPQARPSRRRGDSRRLRGRSAMSKPALVSRIAVCVILCRSRTAEPTLTAERWFLSGCYRNPFLDADPRPEAAESNGDQRPQLPHRVALRRQIRAPAVPAPRQSRDRSPDSTPAAAVPSTVAPAWRSTQGRPVHPTVRRTRRWGVKRPCGAGGRWYNLCGGWPAGCETDRPDADPASRPLCVLCRVRPVHRGPSRVQRSRWTCRSRPAGGVPRDRTAVALGRSRRGPAHLTPTPRRSASVRAHRRRRPGFRRPSFPILTAPGRDWIPRGARRPASSPAPPGRGRAPACSLGVAIAIAESARGESARDARPFGPEKCAVFARRCPNFSRPTVRPRRRAVAGPGSRLAPADGPGASPRRGAVAVAIPRCAAMPGSGGTGGAAAVSPNPVVFLYHSLVTPARARYYRHPIE